MSAPAPLQSFLGGIALAVPLHDLLTLNGSIFGISGFLHRSICGYTESMASVLGLFSGGVVVGLLQRTPPEIVDERFSTMILSGLLVGAGSKLSNGCTSGSAVATTSFFVTGVITTSFIHATSLTPIDNLPYDLNLGILEKSLIVLQGAPMAISAFLHLAAPRPVSSSLAKDLSITEPLPFLRHIAALTTAFQFALALRLSNLSSPTRVIRFLVTPLSPSVFDPSLAALAVGALPVSIFLYHFRGSEEPRLGGSWDLPTNKTIDFKLVFGAALFGIGWAIQGICPGPAILNFGTSFIQGDASCLLLASWLGAVVVGGLAISPFCHKGIRI